MSHLKRWITGLTALPILIWVISYSGSIGLAVVVTAVSILALVEYFQITLKETPGIIRLLLTIPAYVVTVILILSAQRGTPLVGAGALMANLLIAGIGGLVGFPRDTRISVWVAMQAQGVVYIPLMMSTLVMIRSGPDGIIWIYFLLAVVFAGDIGALYAGTFLGKHKLCPGISPKKTIEGSVGGILANLVVGLGIHAWFLPDVPRMHAVSLILVIGAAGQIGDLFESVLKRTAGIKDSGSILPGHGGMLDRIDALLFAAPSAWIFLTLVN
jgi:phosphatidate cytidylyltransferase